MWRNQPADHITHADAMWTVNDRDHFNVIFEQESEADRLAEFLAEPAHPRLRRFQHMHRRLIRNPSGGWRKRKPIALHPPQVSADLKRPQDAECGALGKVRLLRDLAQSKRTTALLKYFQNTQRIADRSGKIAFGGLLNRLCRHCRFLTSLSQKLTSMPCGMCDDDGTNVCRTVSFTKLFRKPASILVSSG